MQAVSKADILKLSVAERILLVEDIWDSIAELPEELALSEAQQQELDRRLEAYHQDPETGSPWVAVEGRIRSS
ncbi:MAG: addiction module protein [Thermodesulfobacteriota bacterium]